MQKARRHPDSSGLRPRVRAWFQGLFTPLLGVLFTFPLQYWFTIGLSVVFSLTRWCWHIQTEFLRFRLTHHHYNYSSSTGLSPPTVYLSRYFYSPNYSFRAPPLSLATTRGITIVLFSSGYLDVSVPRVTSLAGVWSSTRRVPPFGHLRINARLQLPAAFRSLPRPSSSPRA